jgi:hypothetical protein
LRSDPSSSDSSPSSSASEVGSDEVDETGYITDNS